VDFSFDMKIKVCKISGNGKGMAHIVLHRNSIYLSKRPHIYPQNQIRISLPKVHEISLELNQLVGFRAAPTSPIPREGACEQYMKQKKC
jgi:hypothetical protein